MLPWCFPSQKTGATKSRYNYLIISDISLVQLGVTRTTDLLIHSQHFQALHTRQYFDLMDEALRQGHQDRCIGAGPKLKISKYWSEWQDLNLRPPRPDAVRYQTTLHPFMSIQSTSRRPSLLTPTATITAARRCASARAPSRKWRSLYR